MLIGDFMSIEDKLSGVKMTSKQIQRQTEKIKSVIFDNYVENDDGSYQGDVIDDVVSILEDNIPLDVEIDDSMFLDIIHKCSDKISKYVSSKVNGVDDRLMKLYCYDFVNQSLCSIYSIKLVNKKDDSDDSMYA
jgi:hypothetical protein|tara:strand:+ start:473 stop:874 length:402 start_codon:yes stop_codon:yes gene_type:complete